MGRGVVFNIPFHREDNTCHGLCYTSCGAMTGTKRNLLDPSCGIDPTPHRTISGRSITWLHLVPISDINE